MKSIASMSLLKGTFATLALSIIGCGTASAMVVEPEVEDLYNPFQVLNLHLEMEEADFNTIQHDTTYDIEVPAWFWTDGEEGSEILISVRRKSASALPNEMNPQKVSYKLDINEFDDLPGGASSWHGVKKLSLENGDDMDVVAEGFAWYLHRLAAYSQLDYQAGLAAWVNLYINGNYMGVYVNVEQPDKQYLKNRGLWAGGDETWLYKMSDLDSPEIKEAPEDAAGEPLTSPASELLCFKPFVDRGACRAPGDFKAVLEDNINMEGMLTLGAVSAFHYSPDDLFAKGKNFYYIDYLDGLGLKREYTEWDLDSAFGPMDPNLDMYSQGKGRHDTYEKALVEASDAPFRAEYTAIIDTLVNGGVFDEASLLADLAAMEALLVPHLANDSNSKGAAGTFGALAQFVPLRLASMRAQLPGPPPPAEDGVHVGDLDGAALAIDRNAWDAMVTVTVHDQDHVAVSGALVTGSWSGGLTGDPGCTTGIDGTCSVGVSVTSKRFKKVSFTVSSVVSTGDTYVSSANHDPDGDSDGTTISIARP